ncbi:MAG: hypothetical protein RJA44_567 [Pseudomonadota bacterium]|jgi:isoquinoline 1-oxidoreductase alpha subunit
MKLDVNRSVHELPEDLADPEMPLLWALRDLLQLTGTKYGCDNGSCGACTVRMDGQAVRSCRVPLSATQGRRIQTIEGLAGRNGTLHPLQQVWLERQVPQCGYCQSGLLMAAAALLGQIAQPTEAQIEAQIAPLCRCGSLVRVRQAIRSAAQRSPERNAAEASAMPDQIAAELPDLPQPLPQPARTKGHRSSASVKARVAKVRAAKRRQTPGATP